MANERGTFWDQPGWLFCALLPLLHFASVKLTFLCGVTPENVVVVWLPNAVLLAALMRFEGQRAPLLAALTFCSDVLANVQAFGWTGATLLSIVNIIEVAIAYQLMRLGGASFLPRTEELITMPRMKDWLKLLNMTASQSHFGCYAPACRTEKWLHRYAFMDNAGPRWWPFFGGVYIVQAIKRVKGMHLIGPAWTKKSAATQVVVPATNKRRE